MGSLGAQDATKLAVAHLQSQHAAFGLQPEDVLELHVSDYVTSQQNSIHHVYVQQYYGGVPIYNAIASFHYKGDRLVHHTNRLQAKLAEEGIDLVPALSAADALLLAARPLDISTRTRPMLVNQQGKQATFDWAEISSEPIKAVLTLVPFEGRRLISWQFVIDQRNTPDVWLTQIDGNTGRLLARYNQTLYCSFNGMDKSLQSSKHIHHAGCHALAATNKQPQAFHEKVLAATLLDGSVYNVFPFGIESPTYGGRQLISEPADPVASPFGWHDTDGAPGAEFTITRGNNVFAYPDRTGNDSPDPGVSADGGDSLRFDFYYADGASPDTLIQAALAQVFYMTNMVHDFSYHHGFDERAGNFQANNYGRGGAGGDAIRAEAQDGSGENNANFSTPADGGSGRMQMFLWNNSGGGFIIADEPAAVAGEYEAGAALFGPQQLEEPVTGKVVIAFDNSTMPELVCGPIANVDDVKGNIALIRRGECFFEEKVLFAQAAEAIAVIICNPENTILNMAGGVDNDEPTIPAALLRESDCALFRAAIAAGDSVFVTFPATELSQPIDGDFDNGIVAHEIGHGISNRTVGGPNNTSCLFNREQMGEGWSDFFSLATSPINGAASMPNGSERRSIGNFATGRGPTGGGIRRLPYSTDMTINNHTYDRIITSGVPHPLGEIWATTLWDLYWALVDEMGFDEDLINGNGGNNIAVRLVIEGMKNTSCNPGMVDGREGILAADALLYDGAYTCLIWDVFARRGLGYLADQGSSDASDDGREHFESVPSCFKTVKLEKTSDVDVIMPGDEIQFNLKVSNDKLETVTNIIITDELPEGLTLIPGSVAGATSFTLNAGSITFTLTELEADEQTNIRYRVSTDPSLHSISYFFDGAEEGDENWTIEPLQGTGTFIWEQSNEDPYDGDFVWFVANAVEANDQVLSTFEPLELVGEQPVVRFFTKYATEAGWDGGLVEMSTNGTTWTHVPKERFLRGAYRGRIQPSAFTAPATGFDAYWGNSGNNYFDAYIDFSDMAGQSIYLRWRFGSDSEVAGTGWWVDNIEQLDLFRYTPTATLSTTEGDEASANLPKGGVMVEPALGTNVNDPRLGTTQVKVFPNPAKDIVQVVIRSEHSGPLSVQLIGIDGRVLSEQHLNSQGGSVQTQFQVAQLPTGVYLLQVTGTDRIHTEKVVIR